MEQDFRVKMSLDEFSRITCDENNPCYEYYEKFYAYNDKIAALTNEELRMKLTKGLKLLVFITIFDGQVGNGGIAQFFWNCPDLIFDVGASIEFLQENELLAHYTKACESLFGNKENWLKLRDEAYLNKDNPNWESFVKTYDLLDLEWFESLYFDKYSHENGKIVVTERGLQHRLMKKLEDYVRRHPEEFIY